MMRAEIPIKAMGMMSGLMSTNMACTHSSPKGLSLILHLARRSSALTKVWPTHTRQRDATNGNHLVGLTMLILFGVGAHQGALPRFPEAG
jgi:hypothetical protein